jgi:hypothetical protein
MNFPVKKRKKSPNPCEFDDFTALETDEPNPISFKTGLGSHLSSGALTRIFYDPTRLNGKVR